MTRALPVLSSPPSEPHATDMEVKLTAALEAAAAASKGIAEECQKAVEESKPPLQVDDDEKEKLRCAVHQSMETTIKLLRKMNGNGDSPPT